MFHYHDFGPDCISAEKKSAALLTKLSTACSGIKKGFPGKRLSVQAKKHSKEHC
jgi:hypothetical protein